MGASQSVVVVGKETPSGFYVLKSGRYVSVCAKTLKMCYISEDEITPLHQEMITKGVLIQVQLYERITGDVEAYQPSAKKFYRLLTAMALINRNIEEYWTTRMFEKLIGIMRPIKDAMPAIDIYAIASQLIDASIRNPSMSRDDLTNLARPITDDAIRGQVVGTLVSGLGELSAKIIRGGAYDSAQDEEPLPMVTGGAGDAGDADKSSSDVVKNLYLEKFSKQRSEIIEHVLGFFNKMPYDAMKAAIASGTNEEKLRKLAMFLKSNSAKDPESITRSAVDALNKEFGVTVIDPSLPANIKLSQLAELLNSMSSRVSADFFLMGIDINHDIRAVTKLLDALQIWYNAAEARLDQVEGATLLAPLKDIINEFKRYLDMMNMALNQYFMPTLPGFLAQGEEMKARSRGEVQLSDRIMDILRGFVSTAGQATALSVSLQKLGMDPNEFKLLKDKNEFWRRFAQLVTNEKLLASSQPKEFFDAAVFAVKSLGNKDELVAEIERQKHEKVGRGVNGGAPGVKPTPEVLAVERLSVIRSRTKIVLNSYGQVIQSGIRKIRETIDHFADVIGTEIPVGSLLDNFRDLLRQLADVKLEIPQIHLALLGYFKDATARETRDKTIGSLKQVAKYAEFVTSDGDYTKSKQYFLAIRDAIDELIASIDQAFDNLRSVVGGVEGEVKGEIEGGVEGEVKGEIEGEIEGEIKGEIKGGVEGGISQNWEPLLEIRDLIIRDKLKLIDSVEKVDYMVRVARLKSNLKKMVTEFPVDTRTYDEKVLGPAVAARINVLEKARNYVLTQLGFGKPSDIKSEVGHFNPTDTTSSVAGVNLNGITPFELINGKTVDQAYDFLHDYHAAPERENASKKEITKTFVDDYYKGIIGFWESAQAIELYLKYFTNAIISNPGDIQDISLMIREVEVITRMYDENSGDAIAKIFEMNFPSNKNLSNTLAAPGTMPTPAIVSGQHYLEWTNIGAFPFTQLLKDRMDKMLKESFVSLGKYVALKNLLSFFIHFGSKIGGSELRRMAPRTPSEIYQGLMRYLSVSAFGFGFRRGTIGDNAQTRMTYKLSTGQFICETGTNPPRNRLSVAARGANYVAVAPGNESNAIPAGGDRSQLYFGCGATLRLSDSIFMRPSQQNLKFTVDTHDYSLFDPETGLDLTIENQAFSAIIKSLGAKILIISGMHDLINRPHESHESRASVRVILGAAEGEMIPKIEDSITELYVRLPLLALFYKKHFTKDSSVVKARYMKDEAKIILLPDLVGSVFSEFINIFFRKYPHDNLQFLTDNELKLLIPEINKIYHQLASKYPVDTIRSILNEFAETMSRMIYIIGAGDEEQYWKLFETQVGTSGLEGVHHQMFRDEIEDPDILGDEGDEDVIKRLLPADKERMFEMDITKKDPGREFVVKGEHWNLVKKFRCMLDSELTKESTISLRGSIVATQIKLGQTAGDVDRFYLVSRLLRGTGNATPIENLRKMIFSEVLGTGLGMLTSIYTIVRLLQIVGYATNADQILAAVKNNKETTANMNETVNVVTKEIAKTLSLDQLDESDSNDNLIVIKNILGIAMGGHYDAHGFILGWTQNEARSDPEETNITLNYNGVANVVTFGQRLLTLNMNASPAIVGADKAIKQHMLHYPSAMGLLLETIATVKSHTHEMVRVDISNHDLLIDCSMIQEYVKKFLMSLVSFVDVMRPHIDPKVVDRYTKKENPGSLYWLQEQFVEKLFEGRVTATGGQKYSRLSELTAIIRDGFKQLTSSIDVDITWLVANNTVKLHNNPFYVDYSQVLANIIVHNHNALYPRADANWLNQELYHKADIFSNSFDSIMIRGLAGEKTIDTRYLYSLSMTSEDQVYTDTNNSILFSFNKLLSMYLRQFYDASTGKIFTGLIDTFAQGTFNNVIMTSKNTYPDHLPTYYVETSGAGNALVEAKMKHIISVKDYRQAIVDITGPDVTGAGGPAANSKYILYVQAHYTRPNEYDHLADYHSKQYGLPRRPVANEFVNIDLFGNRRLPDGNHVLFASIGHILKHLLTATDERTQIRTHLLDSAADIPMYLREKYRAHIPFFRAAFDSLMHKCEFYKQIMEEMEEKCFNTKQIDNRYSMEAHGYKFEGTETEKLLGVLKSIASGSSALVQDCSRALTDVGDQPKYFETQQDSINAYKAQNNGDPIMPISPLLRIMRGDGFDNREDILPPKYGLGDTNFKYQYAIRGLYHHMKAKQEVVNPLQTLTAFESMVTLFNKYSHGGIKIDGQLAQNLAKLFVDGFDFLHDIRRVKSFISITHADVFASARFGGRVITPPLFSNVMRNPNLNVSLMKNRDIRVLSTRVTKDEPIVPTPFGLSAPDMFSIISVVEDRKRDNAIKMVLNTTLPHVVENQDMITANIIDTNIMPFDLHVLARQMPLHFIWNHAFTFDAIAGSMLYDKMKSPSKVINAYFTGCRTDPNTSSNLDATVDTPPEIRSARDAMFAMLADPYRVFTQAEKNWVDRMLVGATGIPEFARPKFLSDQIAGKILLGRILANTQPEVGPPSTPLGTPIFNLLFTERISEVEAERNEYANFIIAYAKKYFEETGLYLDNDDIAKITAILAIARPVTPSQTPEIPPNRPDIMTDAEYWVAVSVRAYNATVDVNGVINVNNKGELDALHNDPRVESSIQSLSNLSKHLPRGTAAVKFVLQYINSAANIVNDRPYGGTDRIIEKKREILDKLLNSWKFAQVNITHKEPGKPLPYARTIIDNDNRISLPDAISWLVLQPASTFVANDHEPELTHIIDELSRDEPIQFDPNVDEYGNVTTTRIPAIPSAQIVHDMRMDTLLIRNLIHIGLVLEIVQMKLQSDLTYHAGHRVTSSSGTLNSGIYKFFGFQTQPDQPTAKDTRKFI